MDTSRDEHTAPSRAPIMPVPFPPKAEKPPKSRRGRPKLDHPKEAITLRLDHELIAHFKSKGRHWRAEMRRVLANAMQAEN